MRIPTRTKGETSSVGGTPSPWTQRFGRSSLRGGRARAALLFLALDLLLGGVLVLWVAGAGAQTTTTLTLNVISARTEPRAFGGAGVTKGDPITDFKYIINIDNTGTTEQRSPAPGSGCSGNRSGLSRPPAQLALDRGGARTEPDLHPGRPGRLRPWWPTCPTAGT